MRRKYWLFGPINPGCPSNFKRQLIIEDCRDCADGYPGRLDGTGAACGAMEGYKRVPEVGDTTPIPIWCPRLKRMGIPDKMITDKDPDPAAL